MKTTIICSAVAFLAAWPTAAAFADDCSFTGQFSEYWHDAGNWTCNDIPDADDDVTIAYDGVICRIAADTDQPEACNTLKIGLLKPGTLIIETTDEEHGKLTVYGNVTLGNGGGIDFGVPSGYGSGCNNLTDSPAILHIAEELTIAGNKPNSIEGGCASEGLAPGIITGADSATWMHVTNDLCAGTTGDPPGCTEPMEIRGHVEIQALMDLNKAVVAVDDASHTLVLSTYQKKGLGTYRVTAGKMQVDAKISGEVYIDDDPDTSWPNWTMNGASAEIEINNGDCETLVGLLNLKKGLLDVNNDFCWEGTFDLHGGSPATDLVIDVASSKSFGAGACP